MTPIELVSHDVKLSISRKAGFWIVRSVLVLYPVSFAWERKAVVSFS